MEILMSKVTQQAMNYAIRSGVAVTASYAIKQSTRLLMHAPKNDDRDELIDLQQRLQNKIRIISPAIDMIELIAARGNTSLQSAVTLTKELRWEIQSLGHRLALAASSQESAKRSWISTQTKATNEVEIKQIITDIKKLLERLEDAVPLMNLAITTSGTSLSSSLPSTVSPSRLLQASTFLTACDTEYSMKPHGAVQVGPTFTLSVYMLFGGHIRPQEEEDLRQMTWKEVMHKARVKLRRVPMDAVLDAKEQNDRTGSGAKDSQESTIPSDGRPDEFAYQLMIIEDLDDDRVHTFEDDARQPGKFDDVELAGIRETFPVHQISKIFYTDTGKVLNIGAEGEVNNPFLLLKRDLNAIPPRRKMNESETVEEEEEPTVSDGQIGKGNQGPHSQPQPQGAVNPWRLPPGLDPEWIALEVFTELEDSDEDESEADTSSALLEQAASSGSVDSQLTAMMPNLQIDADPSSTNSSPDKSQQLLPRSTSDLATKPPPPWVNNIRTSLSLLEMLLRLTSLQQFQQQSHLSITDELLNFFLEESATTGAGGDEMHRQRLRSDARRRVGWDPYDESPMKRRGEDYQYQNGYIEDDGQWSPSGMQTRSITGMSDIQSPSPSPSAKGRKEWLKKSGDRKGSPLRPSTRRSDEGIGTSPASGS
jgi:RanGTP-binding protein